MVRELYPCTVGITINAGNDGYGTLVLAVPDQSKVIHYLVTLHVIPYHGIRVGVIRSLQFPLGFIVDLLFEKRTQNNGTAPGFLPGLVFFSTIRQSRTPDHDGIPKF